MSVFLERKLNLKQLRLMFFVCAFLSSLYMFILFYAVWYSDGGLDYKYIICLFRF